jgi:hypothetical protein
MRGKGKRRVRDSNKRASEEGAVKADDGLRGGEHLVVEFWALRDREYDVGSGDRRRIDGDDALTTNLIHASHMYTCKGSLL